MDQSSNQAMYPTITSPGSPLLSTTYSTDTTHGQDLPAQAETSPVEHLEHGNCAGVVNVSQDIVGLAPKAMIPGSLDQNHSSFEKSTSVAQAIPNNGAHTIYNLFATTELSGQKRNYPSDEAEIAEISALKKTKRDSGLSLTPTSQPLSSPTMSDEDGSEAANILTSGKERAAPVGSISDDEMTIAKRVHLDDDHRLSPVSNNPLHSAFLKENLVSAAPGINSVPLTTDTTDSTTSKSGVKEYEKRTPRRISTETGKHAPITGRRNQFTWADNGHISMSPLKVGKIVKRDMKLKLKDIQGVWHTFPYPSRKTIDINKQSDVTRFNNWRRQAINRPLNLRNKADPRKGAYRYPWTPYEREFLLDNIKQQMESTGQRLSQSDWTEITNRQNRKFAGTIVEPGTSLPPTRKTSKPKIKTAQILPERTAQAIQGQVARWSDAKDFIKNLVYSLPETDSDSEDNSKWNRDQKDSATHAEAAEVLNESIGYFEGEDESFQPTDEVEGVQLQVFDQDDPSDDEDELRGAPALGDFGQLDPSTSILSR